MRRLPNALPFAVAAALSATVAFGSPSVGQVNSARVAPPAMSGEPGSVIYVGANPQQEPSSDMVSTNRQSERVHGRDHVVHHTSIAFKASAAKVIFHVPTRVDVNAKVTMSGQVPIPGTGKVRRPVQIQQLVDNKWRLIYPTKANLSGKFKVTMNTAPYPMIGKFRAVAPKSSGMRAATSATRTIGFGSPEEIAAIKRADTAKDWTWGAEGTTWAQCQLTWAYKPQGGYVGAESHARKAFAMIDKASRFSMRQVARSADPDIVIGWSTPQQDRSLNGSVAGVAHLYATDSHYYNALIHLDRTKKRVRKVFNGRDGMTWGAVMAHEIGHVVGLDHADGQKQLMHAPIVTGALGVGDKAGLAAVSKGCSS